MSNTIKDIENMSMADLAFELRMWANIYKDLKNNYDAVLLLRCAKIIEKIPEKSLTPAQNGV